MFWFTCLGLGAIFFVSVCSASLHQFSRHRLEETCRKWDSEKRLGLILKHYERMRIAADTARILAVVCFLFLFAEIWGIRQTESLEHLVPLHERLGNIFEYCGFLVVGLLLLLSVVLWIPTAIARIGAAQIVFHTYYFWSFVTRLLFPLELFHRFFTIVVNRLAGYQQDSSESELFEEEIRTIVTEGHREGLLEEDAREMIESVIELGDVSVSEIMTPRTDMICISNVLSWDEMLGLITTISYSRIPVYCETRDDIVGILYLKDLIPELAKKATDRVPWTQLLRPPHFVPETKPVDKLLQEFQQSHIVDGAELGQRPQHKHVAIVLDEYGGVSGLVSLEDILEEIVGEIADEHDPIVENEVIRQTEVDVFEVGGKVHLDELNEHLQLELPDEEDYDTIAGYIFSTLGHVPQPGEFLVFEKENKKIRITVLEATTRRIERVRVERLREE
ncbi:MAG: hemolysin family protein [Thermoguttaceae bacterium]